MLKYALTVVFNTYTKKNTRRLISRIFRLYFLLMLPFVFMLISFFSFFQFISRLEIINGYNFDYGLIVFGGGSFMLALYLFYFYKNYLIKITDPNISDSKTEIDWRDGIHYALQPFVEQFLVEQRMMLGIANNIESHINE